MRKFESNRAAGFQCSLETGGKVVDVGHVRVDVVADDQVRRRPSLPRASFGQVSPKNSRSIGMPTFRRLRAVLAVGSMPRQGMPACDKMPEQVAVIGGDLDHEAVGAEAAGARRSSSHSRGMVAARSSRSTRNRRSRRRRARRRARESSVCTSQQFVADVKLQRKSNFRRAQVGLGEIGIRGGAKPRSRNTCVQRRMAVPAVHTATPSNAASSGGSARSRRDRSADAASGQRIASRGSSNTYARLGVRRIGGACADTAASHVVCQRLEAVRAAFRDHQHACVRRR